nr:hypothetical protein [Microbacterium thalassium]
MPLALAAGLLAGCATDPEPVEPTPAFATEEEAFAAAEATYRAYVDALNRVDLSDPATFEDVYAWTTGEANANERESLSGMHANGWTVSGETVVVWVEGTASDDSTTVTVACTSVGSVAVVDATGDSVVDSERADHYALQLEMTYSRESPTGLFIASSNAIQEDRCG